MTTFSKTEYDKLIKQLLEAKEGSRELDAKIASVLVSLFGKSPQTDIPHYTTSLDSAFLLIPPQWSWDVGTFYRDHLPTPLASAHIANDRNGITSVHKGACFVEEAATAPLAICIAALTAQYNALFGIKPKRTKAKRIK